MAVYVFGTYNRKRLSILSRYVIKRKKKKHEHALTVRILEVEKGKGRQNEPMLNSWTS